MTGRLDNDSPALATFADVSNQPGAAVASRPAASQRERTSWRYASGMHSPDVILPLERPFAEFSRGTSEARAVLLAGLRWPTEYWVERALQWLDEGAPADADSLAALETIASKQFSERVRHRAQRAATRLRKVGA